MTELHEVLEPLGAKRRRRQPEKRIQAQILTGLQYRGFFAFPLHNHGLQNRFGRYNRVGRGHVNGVPDIAVVLKAGRMLWLEVKAPAGTQSDDQKKVEARMKEHGHDYRIVRSFEDVLALLRAQGLVI